MYVNRKIEAKTENRDDRGRRQRNEQKRGVCVGGKRERASDNEKERERERERGHKTV